MSVPWRGTLKSALTEDLVWRVAGRWLHKNSDTSNCYSGNRWDPSICPDVQSCAQNCVLEGADEEYLMDEEQNIYDMNLKQVGKAGDDDDNEF